MTWQTETRINKININKNFRGKTQDINTESERIIETAATLIKTEIRDQSYSDFYPTKKEIQSPWIPDNLQAFLSSFTKSSLKQDRLSLINFANADTPTFVCACS